MKAAVTSILPIGSAAYGAKAAYSCRKASNSSANACGASSAM